MKNMAVLAVILAALSNAVSAESAVSEAPSLTLAMSNNVSEQWIKPVSIKTEVLNSEIEAQVLEKTMDQVSKMLDKQLEDKMAKELDYAMH